MFIMDRGFVDFEAIYSILDATLSELRISKDDRKLSSFFLLSVTQSKNTHSHGAAASTTDANTEPMQLHWHTEPLLLITLLLVGWLYALGTSGRCENASLPALPFRAARWCYVLPRA